MCCEGPKQEGIMVDAIWEMPRWAGEEDEDDDLLEDEDDDLEDDDEDWEDDDDDEDWDEDEEEEDE